MRPQEMTETFDFYGFIVELKSDHDDVVREVSRDFAWFAVPEDRAISITSYARFPR